MYVSPRRYFGDARLANLAKREERQLWTISRGECAVGFSRLYCCEYLDFDENVGSPSKTMIKVFRVNTIWKHVGLATGGVVVVHIW